MDEVIIPPKRDDRGKRYGFAGFFEVQNAEVLTVELDNIFIGRRKLHVNLPKYEEVHQGDWGFNRMEKALRSIKSLSGVGILRHRNRGTSR